MCVGLWFGPYRDSRGIWSKITDQRTKEKRARIFLIFFFFFLVRKLYWSSLMLACVCTCNNVGCMFSFVCFFLLRNWKPDETLCCWSTLCCTFSLRLLFMNTLTQQEMAFQSWSFDCSARLAWCLCESRYWSFSCSARVAWCWGEPAKVLRVPESSQVSLMPMCQDVES